MPLWSAQKSDSLHVHVKLNCVVNSILNFNLFFFVESKESNHHIWTLIVFPPSDIVFILKSIPEKEKYEIDK